MMLAALEPLGYYKSGRPIYPILGGAPDDGDADGDGGDGGDQSGQNHDQSKSGSYVPPATQEDLDKIIQDRLRRHKPADYDDLRDKADRLEALELEMSTDQEKATVKARQEERAAVTPRLVRAEFKAAAKGVLSADQLSAVLEDLDLSKYVDSDGEVDEDKVQRKILALAPKNPNGSGNSAGFGQGSRPATKPSARELGAAEAAKRFAKKTA